MSSITCSSYLRQFCALLVALLFFVGCDQPPAGETGGGTSPPTPTAPSIASFGASPSTITAGNSTTLSWSAANATSLSIDNGVGAVTGTSKTVSPAVTTTYTLTATNARGSTTATTTVTVNPVAPPLPTISSFTASPATITAGTSTTLNWTVTNATSLSINNGVGAVTGASRSVSPTQTTTYTLTASNATGSATATVTVTVNVAAPVITSFMASPTTVTAGTSTMLSWAVTNATSISIDNGIGVVTSVNRSVTPTSTTTYTLTAANATGSKTATVTVTVNQAPTAPTIASFHAMPMSIAAGAPVTLMWSVANATSLNISGIGAVTGTQVAVNPSVTTTYTLTATNSVGSTTGTATVTVGASGGTAQRAVPNNKVPTGWTPCTSGVCYFDGLRQVRFGNGNGDWVIKTYLSEFWAYKCSTSEFGRDPAPGQSKRCEIANIREAGTIAAPTACHKSADGCTTIDLTNIPLGVPGYSTVRIQPDTDTHPNTPDGGSFRTLCAFSHMSFDDPIVYPGRPSVSHLHAFFGNTGADAFSTPTSVATTGNSTCSGGIANRTAYWIPALIDTRNGAPVVPAFTIWYYKTFTVPAYPLSANEAIPSGLRMVAGDMRATGPQSMTHWTCFNAGGDTANIPNCAPGDSVQMTVAFPACWDGVHLDSDNHKSHMAYSNGAEGCPDSHPHPVPNIILNVRYLVQNAGDPTFWRLSSDMNGNAAGLSAHADWFDGWIPSVRDTWVRNCSQSSTNCEVDNLGDGTELY